MSLSGVTLGMGAPCWRPRRPFGAPCRPLSPQEAVLSNVSFRIEFRQNSENDGKNLKKMYIYYLA